MNYRSILSYRAPLAVVLLFLISLASADVAIEGMRNYDYQYVISNMSDYPDYVFMTSSAIWGWQYPSLVNGATGSFGGGYKLDGFVLHAVKASYLDRDMMKEAESNEGEASDSLGGYLKGNQHILTANITLPKAGLVKETVPLDTATVYLRIDSITDNALNVSKERVVYNYTGGKVEELTLKDDEDVPTPSYRSL